MGRAPLQYPGMQPCPPGWWLAEAGFPPVLWKVAPLLSPFSAYLSITHYMPASLLGRHQRTKPRSPPKQGKGVEHVCLRRRNSPWASISNKVAIENTIEKVVFE